MTISDYVRRYIREGKSTKSHQWAIENSKCSVSIVLGHGGPRTHQRNRIVLIYVGIDWITQQLPITIMTAKLGGKLPKSEIVTQTGVGKLTVHPSEVGK